MRKSTKVILGFLVLFLTTLPSRAHDLIVCDDVTDPATLDPQKEFSEKNHTIVQQIYEGLVRFDPNGKVEPALAVSWERLDPLRMRFHLRRGVAFHNGEPFGAQAVKFSIERYINPATQFPAFGFISSLDRVDIVDDYTVDIVTKFPDGLLINRLAGFILIVPPEYVKKNGDLILSTAPIGTGAFKFEKWEKGKEIALSANKSYWMPGFPKVDRLVFKFIPLEQQIDDAFAGKIDILTELPGTQTTSMYEHGGKIIKQSAFYTVATTFRNDGPLANLKVRQAINYAIDKDSMIRYDLLANGDPLGSLTFPGEFGHNPNIKPFPHDITKAKKLLAEAGYSNGFALKAFTKAQGARAANIIKACLKDINIDMSIDMKTDAEIPAAVASGKYDVGIGGCPDPMAHSFFIQSIFLFSQSPYSLVKSEVYDKMLLDMVFTLDPIVQEKKSQALDKWIYDNAMGIFTYQRIKTYGCRKNIQFVPSVTGMPYFYATEKK